MSVTFEHHLNVQADEAMQHYSFTASSIDSDELVLFSSASLSAASGNSHAVVTSQLRPPGRWRMDGTTLMSFSDYTSALACSMLQASSCIS